MSLRYECGKHSLIALVGQWQWVKVSLQRVYCRNHYIVPARIFCLYPCRNFIQRHARIACAGWIHDINHLTPDFLHNASVEIVPCRIASVTQRKTHGNAIGSACYNLLHVAVQHTSDHMLHQYNCCMRTTAAPLGGMLQRTIPNADMQASCHRAPIQLLYPSHCRTAATVVCAPQAADVPLPIQGGGGQI